MALRLSGGRPTRVLVVDDSIFMRKLITSLLEEDPSLVVVGQARDGEDALRRVRELDPDVITLDVEMPRLDGLGVLRRLMPDDPRPVVMVSGVTRENAEATVRSLELGAVDFLTKPSGSVSPDLPLLRQELHAKVKAAASLGKEGVQRLLGWSPPPRPAPPPVAQVSTEPVAAPAGLPCQLDAAAQAATAARAAEAEAPERLVVVGASTGGPSALHFLLRELGERRGEQQGGRQGVARVAMILVQHIPVGFSAAMARSLNQTAGGHLPVREAATGKMRAGEVLLAPGGQHVKVGEGAVELSLDPPVRGVRPAVDVTLLSAVRVYGRRILAVILTGMGSDGREGAAAVRRAGGMVIAQDQATSVVYGMPRAVTEAGLADTVLPLQSIPEAVATWWNGQVA